MVGRPGASRIARTTRALAAGVGGLVARVLLLPLVALDEALPRRTRRREPRRPLPAEPEPLPLPAADLSAEIEEIERQIQRFEEASGAITPSWAPPSPGDPPG